ncbi:MAG TPA: HD domain-containing protein [Candidatus Saccharimonadales bacterium]|nr:HD domain-containing protein [Candidatus Saccharimonadales bacterium]
MSAGFAAYVVGGSVRDVLLSRAPLDWDLATSARPEQMQALFPDAVYENQFGTVAVRRDVGGDGVIAITTFRTDHDYADFRRPHHVEFGDALELDLARRDFTVNAMAWGAEPGDPPHFVDPYDGRGDLTTRTLRAVGDPLRRFEEDALRMIRAIRLATVLGFDIEPATLAGITARAELVRHLSGERIAAELERLLRAPQPSVGLGLMLETGVLAQVSADLAAQRGVPQNKVPGEDLWDHTIRAVDAAAAAGGSGTVRTAALLHDIGKPATFADGRFLRHEAVGAELAGELLDRLRWPRAERERIVRLVRLHMFGYESSWSDAAIRRFIAKVGLDELDDLFALRRADNLGSGLDRDAGHLDELVARVAGERAAGVVLDLRGLAIGGDDLIAELGVPPGPELGRLLDTLLERVIADPRVNRRSTLLAEARALLAAGGAP